MSEGARGASWRQTRPRAASKTRAQRMTGTGLGIGCRPKVLCCMARFRSAQRCTLVEPWQFLCDGYLRAAASGARATPVLDRGLIGRVGRTRYRNPSPLRTVRATFTAHGSSTTKASLLRSRPPPLSPRTAGSMATAFARRCRMTLTSRLTSSNRCKPLLSVRARTQNRHCCRLLSC